MPFSKAAGISVTSIAQPTPIARNPLILPALFVGEFDWGPVGVPITITSVNDLTKTFGQPNDSNRIDWMVIRDYIRTAGHVRIIRVAKPGARNAVLSKYRLFSMTISNAIGEFVPGDCITITDTSPDVGMPVIYPCIDVGNNTYTNDRARSRLVVVSYDSDTGQLDFAAEYKYNGVETVPCQIVSEILSNTISKRARLLAGNDLPVETNGSHDIIVPLLATNTMLAVNNTNRFIVKCVDTTLTGANTPQTFQNIEHNVIKFSPKTNSASGTTTGILSNHVCINNTDEFLNLSISVNPAPLHNNPIKFIAKYPGELGNSLGVVCVQPGFEITLPYAPPSLRKILNGLPSLDTTQTAINSGFTDLKDEIHIVVYDTDGAITGQAGTVLETYTALSVLRGAKNNGVPIFFIDYINTNSSWIYAIDVPYKQEGFDSDASLRLFFNQTNPEQNYTQAEQILPAVTQFEVLPISKSTPVVFDITQNTSFNIESGETTISGDIAAETNAIAAVYSQLPLLRFTNNTSETGVYNAQVFAQAIVNSYSITIENKINELSDQVWSISTDKTAQLAVDHEIKMPGIINQNFNGRVGFDFPCTIEQIKNGVTDISKATVRPAHIWNGLNFLRDLPDGKTATLYTWINQAQQSQQQTANPYALFGVSGFACDNPKLFANRNNVDNELSNSGLNGYATKNQLSALVNEQISKATFPIDIIIGGNLTVDGIKARMQAVESSTGILFASVPSSLTMGFDNMKIANSVVAAFADFNTEHLFVDSGWYNGFDEITGEPIIIPLCGLTAGLANNKAFPWSPFAGRLNGVYPNVSNLLFDPTEEAVRGALYAGKINPVYSGGNGVILNGNKLATNKNTLLSRIEARRALSIIEIIVKQNVENLLFSFGDSIGYADIENAVSSVMFQFVSSGATERFQVQVGATDLERSQRVVNVTIQLQLLESINWIEMRIVSKYSLTNSGFTN